MNISPPKDEGHLGPVGVNAALNVSSRRAASGYPAPAYSATQDSVSVSPEATQLAHAVDRAQKQPDTRSAAGARILALQAQAQAGTMLVDRERLADAMLRDEGAPL